MEVIENIDVLQFIKDISKRSEAGRLLRRYKADNKRCPRCYSLNIWIDWEFREQKIKPDRSLVCDGCSLTLVL